MRIGQLARKYDISVQDILTFLEETTGEKFHPNSKVYDAVASSIYIHFDVFPLLPREEEIEKASIEEPVATEEQEPEIAKAPEVKMPAEPQTPEEDIASVDGEIASLEEVVPEKTEPEAPVAEVAKRNEDEVIPLDRLLQMLESDEPLTDLEKIKLIKAPKKELSGLKVLGKIEIPEDPRKKTKEQKEEAKKTASSGSPQLSEQEKEKRRLQEKRKKEAYEAQQEKKRKEEEAKRKKARKEAHYKQIAKQPKTQPVKQKAIIEEQPVPTEVAAPSPPAKTSWWGKFRNWMNA